MNETDRIRLEEVRKSAEYLIVGIDVAKDKHHAFFGTAKAVVRLEDEG